ncbi:MAG: ribosome biogenesis GTPase Der [Myxococcota bacterium]
MPDRALSIVAIVGRPNVGKSTLFNRYAGHRRALVEDTPGLTRDRIAEEVEVGSRRLLLVDTAGLEPGAREELAGAVQRQAQEALTGADAVLFVVDGREGPLPLDREIADTLRRSAKPVALAVNKVDVPAHADRVAAFYELGLGTPQPVSAEHGGGAWDLLERLAETLPVPGETGGEEADDASLLRVALVGRPNVGKSSLLNQLVGSERVVVSEVPGTTRDAVDMRLDTEDGSLVLVDTAGLRRAARRQRVGERGGALMTVRALERARVALVVIDGAAGVTDQDAHIAALALERGCACALLINKWDLVKGQGSAEQLGQEIERRLRFLPDPPILRVSAKTGQRVDRIPAVARSLAGKGERRLSTSELNRWLREAVERHEPAMAQRGSRRRPLKFFYATQTGVSPPTFLLFCTDPLAIRPAYRRFLENRLRERFDFAGTPIRLRLRARREANG